VKSIVKIAISLALVAFVLNTIDTQKLAKILLDVNLIWLFLAFVFYNISKIVSAFRLVFYFKEIGISIEQKANLVLYYVGMFYNLFLPGGIGGDGYKAYLLNKHHSIKLSLIVQALLFDRISGLVALIFLGAILYPFSSFDIPIFYYLSIALAVLIYPIFFIISKKLNRFLLYFKHTTLLGLCVQVLQLISALFIIYSLNSDVPAIEFLVLFLVSSVVSVLPITVGGIGVRELTFLYGLALIGYPSDIGVAFSFLFFLITMLSSLIGVLFLHKPYGGDKSEATI
jgi:uncharacterized membrane protein YbhN (UPF0104 family)